MKILNSKKKKSLLLGFFIFTGWLYSLNFSYFWNNNSLLDYNIDDE